MKNVKLYEKRRKETEPDAIKFAQEILFPMCLEREDIMKEEGRWEVWEVLAKVGGLRHLLGKNPYYKKYNKEITFEHRQRFSLFCTVLKDFITGELTCCKKPGPPRKIPRYI